jgi:hypothetical protein
MRLYTCIPEHLTPSVSANTQKYIHLARLYIFERGCENAGVQVFRGYTAWRTPEGKRGKKHARAWSVAGKSADPGGLALTGQQGDTHGRGHS